MVEDYGLPARYMNLVSLGSGAIGSVFKVTDSQSGRILALKLITSSETTIAETLENEFSTLSNLSHPNLIKVYDYGRSETGHPYFTMDYIEGPDLRSFLITRPHAIHVQTILMDILQALEYLADRNIVHGDIKPENILLADNVSSDPIFVEVSTS